MNAKPQFEDGHISRNPKFSIKLERDEDEERMNIGDEHSSHENQMITVLEMSPQNAESGKGGSKEEWYISIECTSTYRSTVPIEVRGRFGHARVRCLYWGIRHSVVRKSLCGKHHGVHRDAISRHGSRYSSDGGS